MGLDATDTDARHLGDAQPPRHAGARMGRWAFAVFLLVLALVLRLTPLNRYVTPDEPAWVYRSIRFSQALAARDLDAVPATGHPGVTTMWLGSLGVQIRRWLSPDQAAAHLDWLDGLAGLSPQSPAAFRHLAFFIPAGRVLVAVVTSLGLVGVFFLVNRLWGLPAAVLATLFLALDPFLTGHSGLLHLDGLLAAAITLSALAMLLAVHSFRLSNSEDALEATAAEKLAFYRWTVVSGLLAGLALLTKTPGGFLALFVSALILGAWLTRRISWRQAPIALALWALIAALTVFAFYPAFWTDPVGTLRTMLEVGERHVEGAIRPIFFRGQASYDPGPTFYPVVWLFRASPLVIVGVLIALVFYLRHPGPRRYDVIALIALALGFGLFVTLAGKKHDRYLLPAFMPLTLIAALGWVEVGKSVSGRLGIGRLGNWDVFSNLPIPNLLITPLILVQLFLILPYLSAPLGYFNPLLGGPRAALDWLEVGWGEGLGAAARWLNQHPDAKDLIVATSSIPPFASFFVGQTVPLDGQTSYQADYIVCPPRQGADQLPLEPEAGAVVYEKIVGGVRYANVIRNPAPGEQIAYLEDHALQGDLILLDAEAALTHLYDGPADLAVLADARDPAEVAVHLEELIPGHERLWYVALPAASPITARHIQQQLACYGQPVSSDAVAGTAISQIVLNNPQPCDATRSTQHATRSTFHVSRNSDALYLTDALLPDQPIAWPNQLPILVRWDALGPLPADYRTILHLKDEAGRIWAGGGQEILDADYRRPSAWAPGNWTDQTFQLTLPPGIPPGCYTVELGIFDPVSGRALSAWDAAGKFAGLAVKLGQVTVAPPPNPATPWDAVIPERLDPPLVAGHLTLLGHGPPPEQVPSGDRVSFDLFWQAMTAPDTDYSLRWRLHSIGGGIAAEESVPLSPYPSSRWRVRELVQVRYDLSASPDLPAGDYALAVNVLDSNSAPLWSEDVVLAEVEILARDRLFSLPTDIAYPLDVMLGDGVHLRGSNLDALSARPGDQLPLTLYWQADGPTDLSYTVFVHFVGPDGLLYGQSDHPPAGGTAPTHTWAPSQVIIDEVVLPVLADAPSGTYRIVVGLYDAVSGERLPVYDATGTELPNRQIVLPVEITVE